jgi:hypothetical protein
MKTQPTELLTRYGQAGGVWLDGVWDKPMGWRHLDQIAALIHRPRPDGRIDLGYVYTLLAATR